MTAATIALFVSGHGFGHAARSAEVARALLARGARVLVRTDAPPWLFPAGAELLPPPAWPLDVGVAQRDGLEPDVDETRRRWAAFAEAFDRRAEAEADRLRATGAQALLGDVPPLAFTAAAHAAIPCAALANFGWDWIYAPWPGFAPAIARVQEGYRRADLLLRLPLHADDPDAFPAFRRIQDVPLVARAPAHPRAAVRAALGLPPRARVVLLSFGGFDAAGLDLPALAAWRDYLFVLCPAANAAHAADPPNLRRLQGQPTDFVSLLAACDAVVTKPGYGIVADCLVTRVPVLYTDRGPFREYPVLARALEASGRARHVPREELRRCRLGPHLDALLTAAPPRADGTPPAARPPRGAAVVADQLLRLAAGRA